MALSQDFLSKYDGKIKDTLLSNYVLISSKLEMSGMRKEIEDAVNSTYAKYFASTNSQSGVLAEASVGCSEDEFTVLEFVTLSLISGYFGLSNIDFSISSLNEFGFIHCEECVTLLIKSIFSNIKTSEVIKNEAVTALVSKKRGISFSEYMAQELYVKDLEHIIKCLEPTTEKYFLPEEDEKLILDKLGASFQVALADLKSIYGEIMSDAFGLDKYAGVFTFNRKFGVQGLDLSGIQHTVEPNGVLCDYFAVPLMNHYPVFSPSEGIAEKQKDGSNENVIGRKYSDRQFDYSAIYQGFSIDKSKPVYFPHKMIEILYSMLYTCNIHTQVYKKCKYGKNLEAYLNYLCGSKSGAYDSDDYDKLPPMGREILRAVSYGFSVKLKSVKSEKNERNINSLSDVLANRDNLDMADDFKLFAEDFLAYCVKCYTTCFILTSIVSKKENIYDFRIRACYPSKIDFSNIAYIDEVGRSGKYSSEAMLSSLAEDIHCVNVDCLKYSSVLQDYAYCTNPKLAYGQPLFAYKALYKMMEQGRPISWKSILLGKTEGGGLVTSESKIDNSLSKIKLQDVHIHYLISGSRSGKGVMGYNILGTALVSGMPLFYMDRKPDTAGVMKGICPDMFAINGGDYQQVFDTTDSFNPSKLPFKIPPYLENFFGGDVELMCDYAYLRGALFALNIAVFMDKCTHKDDARYIALKNILDKGYFIVLDEFTNFTDKFLEKVIVPFSDNGKAVFQALPKVSTYKEAVAKGFDTIKKNNLKLQKLQSQLYSEKSKVDESDLEEAASKIQDAIDDMADSSIDLSKLYWNSFYTKYTSIFETWTSLKNAGAGVMLNTHLFIIGQSLEATLFDSDSLQSSNGKTMFNKTPIESKVTGKKGVASNLFYKFLNDNPSDMITGFQPSDKGKPSYMAQDILNLNSKANNLLTEDKRFFAYKRMPDGSKTKFMYQLSDTFRAFGEDRAEAKNFVNSFEYFKPFLILNTADVPSEEYLYPDQNDHSVVTVDKVFEQARKEKTGSAQYVAQCITSCNKAGITYDELLANNPDVNDPSTLNSLIGFENYMNSLMQYNGSDKSLSEVLGLSGKVANIIVQDILGYNGTFEDYIYDFSAETLFEWRDFDDALSPEGFSVRKSLKDSFFLPFFLTRNAGGETFASVFKEQLGSLYQYYGEESSPSTSGVDPMEREIKNDDAEEVDEVEESSNTHNEDTTMSNEEDDSIEFTKDMALQVITNAISIYDQKHSDVPVGVFFTSDEIDELAEVLYILMNS